MRYFCQFTFYCCMFVCCLWSHTIYAQSLLVPVKGWSVVAGVNFIDFYRHNPEGSPWIGIDSKPSAGFFLGFSRLGRISQRIGYDWQVSYTKQVNDLEVRYSGRLGGNIRSGKFTFDQFNLSFLPTLNLGDKWQFSLGLGPIVGIMTNKEHSLLFSSHSWRYSSVAPTDTEIIVENQHFFKSIYWGMKTVTTLGYPIRESMIVKLYMGYDLGLNDRGKATLVGEKVSSRTITVGLGLCLSL